MGIPASQLWQVGVPHWWAPSNEAGLFLPPQCDSLITSTIFMNSAFLLQLRVLTLSLPAPNLNALRRMQSLKPAFPPLYYNWIKNQVKTASLHLFFPSQSKAQTLVYP